VTASPSTGVPAASRSALDRLVRQLLLIGNASPRALFDLRGSMLLAGVRCTLLSLAMSAVAVVLAVSSLRRVWLADYRHRWPYTAFIVTAVVLLAVVIVGDIGTLTA
jgi:hypothetical protein